MTSMGAAATRVLSGRTGTRRRVPVLERAWPGFNLGPRRWCRGKAQHTSAGRCSSEQVRSRTRTRVAENRRSSRSRGGISPSFNGAATRVSRKEVSMPPDARRPRPGRERLSMGPRRGCRGKGRRLDAGRSIYWRPHCFIVGPRRGCRGKRDACLGDAAPGKAACAASSGPRRGCRAEKLPTLAGLVDRARSGYHGAGDGERRREAERLRYGPSMGPRRGCRGKPCSRIPARPLLRKMLRIGAATRVSRKTRAGAMCMQPARPTICFNGAATRVSQEKTGSSKGPNVVGTRSLSASIGAATRVSRKPTWRSIISTTMTKSAATRVSRKNEVVAVFPGGDMDQATNVRRGCRWSGVNARGQGRLPRPELQWGRDEGVAENAGRAHGDARVHLPACFRWGRDEACRGKPVRRVVCLVGDAGNSFEWGRDEGVAEKVSTWHGS